MTSGLSGGVLLGLLAAALVWDGLRPSARIRLRHLAAHPRDDPVSLGEGRAAWSAWTRWLAAGLIGLAVGALLGWPWGLPSGAAGAALVGTWLSRLPSAADQARRRQREQELPQAADLLAAALMAGSTPAGALGAVAAAVGPPVADDLLPVAKSLAAGASTDEAWASAPADLVAVATAFRRSAESGTPAADALIATADDLRAQQRAFWREQAGRVGVRSALPLGLCFLPAFVLIGIVPVVIGLVRGLLG